jgi:hypothetical protein
MVMVAQCCIISLRILRFRRMTDDKHLPGGKLCQLAIEHGFNFYSDSPKGAISPPPVDTAARRSIDKTDARRLRVVDPT